MKNTNPVATNNQAVSPAFTCIMTPEAEPSNVGWDANGSNYDIQAPCASNGSPTTGEQFH